MPRKPVWTEGLFLTQHHLQQLDRYHEGLVHERLHPFGELSWGVLSIEIDERALAQSQLRVTRLQAILPDGLIVRVGEGLEDTIPPRAFEADFTAQMTSLDVYVAVSQEAPGRANVELEASPVSGARFLRTQVPVADINAGGAEQGFDWGRPNLRLLWGSERREQMTAMRIARIVRGPSGTPALAPTYVPPVRTIGSSPQLTAGFRKLLTAMTTRQRALAQSRRQRTAGALEFRASDTAKFWLLSTINEFLPVVAHTLDRPNTDPESAYLLLVRFIGQLCTFDLEGDPTSLPKYSYLELGEVFETLFTRALALVETVIPERFVSIALERRSDGLYVGRIEDPKLLRHDFFLCATGTMGEEAIRSRLAPLSKIASWGQISPILHSAVNGVPLQHDPTPPGALPLRPGQVFYRLTKNNEFWSDIQSTGTIALYHPFDTALVDISLYAVDPANL